jgi:hypothetical protein
VKQYGSPTEYIDAVSRPMSGIEEERVRRDLGAQARAELERNYKAQIIHPQIKSEEDRRREELIDRANVLQTHFDQCNRSYPRWRSVVGGCYLAGAFFLFWPTLDIFRRVAMAMFRAIKAQWFGM